MIFLHILSSALCFLQFVNGLPRAENAGPAGVRLGTTSLDGGHDGHKPGFLSSIGAMVDAVMTAIGFGVRADDPPDATPRKQVLKTDSPIPGVKRVMIRSGPYIVPNMHRYALPTMESGMLWNYPDLGVGKPCDGECTILKQWAGLEYPNGTNANVDTGLWLHHMIQFTVGPSRWDPVCYERSKPHGRANTAPDKAERYFTAGNERTVFDFNPGGKDLSQGSGYHIGPNDSFSYLVELMNMNMEDKMVYMTMTYDILEGPLPKGWNGVKTFWLDMDACRQSEIHPPQETGSFEIRSPPWTPNFEGKILKSIGHLHDGGIEIETKVSNNSSLCRSKARYSESPQYRYTGQGMGDDKPAKDHISSMEECQPKAQQLSKDQSWQVVGRYNYDEREGNIDRGVQSAIMAIAIVLVEVPPEGVKPPSSKSNKVVSRSLGR